jgi:hypothetical protein
MPVLARSQDYQVLDHSVDSDCVTMSDNPTNVYPSICLVGLLAFVNDNTTNVSDVHSHIFVILQQDNMLKHNRIRTNLIIQCIDASFCTCLLEAKLFNFAN